MRHGYGRGSGGAFCHCSVVGDGLGDLGGALEEAKGGEETGDAAREVTAGRCGRSGRGSLCGCPGEGRDVSEARHGGEWGR